VTGDDVAFPTGNDNETELLLQWLGYLRGAVLRNVDGIDDAQAHWIPDGKLISLIGIVNHLTRVEWRWIDGGFGGADVTRSEAEFHPGPDITIADAVAAYQARAGATDAAVRARSLDTKSASDTWAEGHNLRFVLLHLINETARHCGHADATRELLDGTTGE
jgi:hypothetical protein